MGLVLKKPQLCLLFFFCGWVALAQGEEAPGAYVKVDPKTIEDTAKLSMKESSIMNELAEAATKNKAGAHAIKGIKGLKVEDIRPPNMTVSCIKGVGMFMGTETQITIAGKSFIGGMMQITVRSNMTTKIKMEVAGPTDMKFEVIECGVQLISCKTNLPSSMLPKIVNKFLNSTLGKVLPNMMCPAADKVVGLMKERMFSVFKPCDCGHGVTIQYTLKDNLEKEAHYLGIYFNTVIMKNGAQVPIPTSPPAPDSLPEKREGSTAVFLPVNILNAVVQALEEVFDGAVSSGGTVQATATPTFALEEGKGTLTVPARMEDPAAGRVVTMDVVVGVTFGMRDEKLKVNMELESVNSAVQVSGDTDEATQTGMARAAVSFWNDNLPPICLPSLLGGSYGDAPAQISQNILVLYVGGQ